MDPNIFLYEKNPFLFRGAITSFGQCLNQATRRTDLKLHSPEFDSFMEKCALDYVTLGAPTSIGVGEFYFNRVRDGAPHPSKPAKPIVLPDLQK